MRAMSFGAIADEYDRLRPDPAADAVDWLLPARRDQVVDLAAGTGKLTRALAARAGRVVAVEPDLRMGAVLRSQSPEVRVVAGIGEAIPLRAESADGVFISSAWHWMNADQAALEVARVLRDGGRFGLIWTSRDSGVEWVRKLNQLRDRAPGEEANARRRWSREVLLPASEFTDVETASFGYTMTMSVDDAVEMVGTYSGIIVASEQDRAETLAMVRAGLAEEFPGATEIDVPIRSMCWRANRVAR
jgi:ubiquinone/menaquinone biosynthesis C-methylase UbiE